MPNFRHYKYFCTHLRALLVYSGFPLCAGLVYAMPTNVPLFNLFNSRIRFLTFRHRHDMLFPCYPCCTIDLGDMLFLSMLPCFDLRKYFADIHLNSLILCAGWLLVPIVRSKTKLHLNT